MKITVIAKRVNLKDGHAFISHRTRRNGQWYDVRFTSDVTVTKSMYHDVGNKVMRMFIDVLPQDCNVREDKRGRNVLWVSAFTPLTGDELVAAIAAEQKAIEEYRAAQDSLTRNFFADDAPPQKIDNAPLKQVDSSDADDLPF